MRTFAEFYFFGGTDVVSEDDGELKAAFQELIQIEETYDMVIPDKELPTPEMLHKLGSMCGLTEGLTPRTPMPTLVATIATRAKERLQKLQSQS